MLKHLLTTTVAAAALAAGGFADTALASTASVEDGAVVWRGTDAAETQIYADAHYERPDVLRISGPGVTAGPGCVAFDTGLESGAECPNLPRWRFEARGGDDELIFLFNQAGGTDVSVDLGTGADTFDSGYFATAAHGGEGDDVITSDKYENDETNDDRYFGDGGNDVLIGGYGADELRGGAGDDTLVGDGATGDALPDLADGGDGTDTFTDYVPVYASKGKTAKLTLDGQANDGFPGENDNVIAEKVVSYAALDFTGDDGANEASFSYQDGKIDPAGPSTFRGQAGPDRLTGTLRDDRFEVRDGEVDDVICGAGADTVVADAEDKVAGDCETVERPAAPVVATPAPVVTPAPAVTVTPAPPAAAVSIRVLTAPRLRMASRKGFKVSVAARPGTTVAVKALRAGKVVASGQAIAAPDGAAVVRVRFTKAARKKLRRAKSAALTLTSGGGTVTLTLKR